MNRIADLYLQRIEALLASGSRRLLGIVGPPGAGKSTLAQQLAEALGDKAVVVPMDGYHLANAELNRLQRRHRKGAQDTFDSAGYVALLRRLRDNTPGETVYAPEFDRNLEEPVAGAIAIDSKTPLVITEGNYLLLEQGPWVHVKPLLDEVWYVDIDSALRQSRLVERHVRFGRAQGDALNWVANTDEPNARLIEATAPRADLVFQW
ncbi:nucleoside/nucleotide kinase family protein [Janthinobacterium agaricidamnosum]|uniref:Pantothenate kinase n=1 Tax=Janthinobacterium agaricidamnosum NBRC 102515 = DSM 9628 TaxID=1349767 RepID=W0V020_9BURK|nr:nucleoside/nucleotide kinase family protein [Janthinobacterium agaricidamnosum]CDG80945.1 pantothenate kinase [Janthinobacterium agaricidamnosum NBRC 102515 = DSM 9628]